MTTLIIGGGLSGLALAGMLHAQGRNFLLLEARDRFGGRILTEQFGAGNFDLGPAWFWPGQPRIAALIDRLGLKKFDQYAQGALTFENEQGQVQRGRGFSSMAGSWRLNDGFSALSRALSDPIPAERKRLNAQVEALSRTEAGITATLQNGETLPADRVVLALPPRLAASLTYTPALPDGSILAMQKIPTWMAGQAKALAVYDKPFWRTNGLSGDAMSRHGPMVEIHDASPDIGGPYALFGFIGIPPQGRSDEQLLRQHILAQFERLFGPEAANPAQLFIKDWASDQHTATKADRTPPDGHPTYGRPRDLTGLWDDTLMFAGTEVAPQFGGYIEGALEAAQNVIEMLPHDKAGN